MQRREFLNALAVATIGTSVPATALPIPRLREIGARKDLPVGSAVSYRELQDSAFTALLGEQAGIVVPENEMKWSIIHPELDRYDFSRGDALLAFATEHGQKLRGHNLCWHQQLPKWFATTATKDNAAQLLHSHIQNVAGHYAGHVHSWDVVNEAIDVDDGRPDGLRNSPWLQFLGPDYLDIAFRATREADTKALLTYNEYDLEQDGAKFDAKRNAVLHLLTALRQQSTPVQALGMQAHLKPGKRLPDWAAMHAFCEKVEKLDLQIFVTELDVDDSNLSGDVSERDRQVADVYRSFLSNILQHKSVRVILTWGLTDRDSWLKRNPRADGTPKRPLPFDADLKPKPAFYAMADAITGAERR